MRIGTSCPAGTTTGDCGEGGNPSTASVTEYAAYETANCPTLNAVRQGALRRTTSARIVAIVIINSAGPSPQCSKSANTNAAEVLTPFASGEPAVTSGRTSSITSSPAAT